jgi:hypothetical protein
MNSADNPPDYYRAVSQKRAGSGQQTLNPNFEMSQPSPAATVTPKPYEASCGSNPVVEPHVKKRNSIPCRVPRPGLKPGIASPKRFTLDPQENARLCREHIYLTSEEEPIFDAADVMRFGKVKKPPLPVQ